MFTSLASQKSDALLILQSVFIKKTDYLLSG
jgi:hypothetical protein